MREGALQPASAGGVSGISKTIGDSTCGRAGTSVRPWARWMRQRSRAISESQKWVEDDEGFKITAPTEPLSRLSAGHLQAASAIPRDFQSARILPEKTPDVPRNDARQKGTFLLCLGRGRQPLRRPARESAFRLQPPCGLREKGHATRQSSYRTP